jgi:glycerate 2-kinase
MRVVVAPDKFAGTLSAPEVARAVAAGWRSVVPDAELVSLPLSDGGPGLLDVVEHALGGERIPVVTTDPLGRAVPADVLVVGPDVYVESARAIGLHLIAPEERDPERATSAGLADLLREALERGSSAATSGAGRIVVGLGGSATVDAGRGMIEALRDGDVERLRRRRLVALCDVDNPLLGPNGAAAVFGPQKGADASAVQRLDLRLRQWAEQRGLPADAAGAGAAGGLGAALFWLGATAAPGARTVAELAGLPSALAGADLVVTGEGGYDVTSLRGKVVAGVAEAARAEAVPCVVLAGQVSVGRREMLASGVDAAYAMADEPGGLDAALADPAGVLSALAARVASQWGRG